MDAVAMYSNIDPHHCLSTLRGYLANSPVTRELDIHSRRFTILNALEILFKYNIFKFGDLIVQQTEGIPMGSRPSPPIATIYYGIREEACLLQDYQTNLLDYARFIDDGIGLWDTAAGPNPNRAWEQFSTAVKAWGSLTWIISPLTTQVNFLDVTFTLQNGCINYSLYAKAMNLYLYLPPHSAHPPGVLKGMVYGMFYHFLKLIKNVQDQKRHLQHFFDRLVTRGYSPTFLGPVFQDAQDYLANRCQRLAWPTLANKNKQARERVFLHLPFHPRDPRSRKIQQIFREEVLTPLAQAPLWALTNHLATPSNIRRMIVCYHRPKSLQNLLCPRKLLTIPSSSVSSALHKLHAGQAALDAAVDPSDTSSEHGPHRAVDDGGAESPPSSNSSTGPNLPPSLALPLNAKSLAPAHSDSSD
jgi:hypothetical protein